VTGTKVAVGGTTVGGTGLPVGATVAVGPQPASARPAASKSEMNPGRYWRIIRQSP